VRLGEFEKLFPEQSQHVRDFFERERIRARGTYIQFVSRLYRDIDSIANYMQANRHLRQKDSEDRLTLDLLSGLRQLNYMVHHDAQTGGHVDIDVDNGRHTWIGEAKKDGSFDQGFKQLTTRYVPASGDYNHNHGGLIFYLVKRKNAIGRKKKWDATLKNLGATRTCECGSNPLAMYSEHVLEGPGIPFTIRSMFISLYHSPKDTSGLSKAAGRSRSAKAIR
jgi:hypothetical protein